MNQAELPIVTLKAREERRLRRGHRWVFDSEIDTAAEGLAAGASVRIVDARGAALGSALWNPASRIRARLYSAAFRSYEAHIPEAVRRALVLREQLYPGGHYRLLYGESDGLPGLTVDRYGVLAVLQLNSAVAEAHAELLTETLLALPGLAGLVLRRDGAVRLKEGLPILAAEPRGEMPEEVWAEEGDLRFALDALGGMKGGWFWDQRENRAWLGRAAGGARVLDLFCHSGGFALSAAAGGAASVLGLDRSESALALARRSAEANGLAECCRFKALDLMRGGKGAPGWPHGEWEIVVLDPPALAKGRPEAKAAVEAYLHLNRKAAGRVAPGGILLSCSCTFPVEESVWQGTVLRALRKAGRRGRVLHRGGQGADHPVLPGMPETRYLSVLAFQLD